MVAPIKQIVTVQPDGTIQLRSGLKPGTRAEVTVSPATEESSRPSLSSFFGKGKGLYPTPADVDKFIREERDEWEH